MSNIFNRERESKQHDSGGKERERRNMVEKFSAGRIMGRKKTFYNAYCDTTYTPVLMYISVYISMYVSWCGMYDVCLLSCNDMWHRRRKASMTTGRKEETPVHPAYYYQQKKAWQAGGMA